MSNLAIETKIFITETQKKAPMLVFVTMEESKKTYSDPEVLSTNFTHWQNHYKQSNNFFIEAHIVNHLNLKQ